MGGDSHTAAHALITLNAKLLEPDRVPTPVPPLQQQKLSLALDRATLEGILDPSHGVGRCAQVRLCLEKDAGA